MTRFLNGSAAAVLAVVFVLAVAASVSASPIPSDVEDDQVGSVIQSKIGPSNSTEWRSFSSLFFFSARVRQDQVSSYEVENWIMEKRPFCNAFAGQFTFARVPFKRKTFNMSITTTKNPVKRNQ